MLLLKRAEHIKAQEQLKGHACKLSFLSFLLPPFLCVLAIYIHRYMSSHPEPLAMLGYNHEKVSAFSWWTKFTGSHDIVAVVFKVLYFI